MTAALDLPGIRLAASELISLRAVALQHRHISPFAALPGGHPTRAKGQGIEVADVRHYLPGDDIRHLDRSSTIRTGQLHIRQFQAERDRVRFLVADMRDPMLWGLKRAFLSVAAAEALVLDGWPLSDAGGRVGLLGITARELVVVPARARINGMLDVIGGLVRAHAIALQDAQSGKQDQPKLDLTLRRLDRLAPSGSEIVIASGFEHAGPGFRQVLDDLSQRRSLRLFEVKTTENLPAGRYPVRLEDGRSMSLRLGGRDARKDTLLEGYATVLVDAGAPVAQMAQAVARSHAGHRS